MGGIVARALAKLVAGGEDLLYGVVHGAQPATGAPIAAKRLEPVRKILPAKRFLEAMMLNGLQWRRIRPPRWN